MTICEHCSEAAEYNRTAFDFGAKTFQKHPKNCGCPCMHKDPTQWEDMFSVSRPE